MYRRLLLSKVQWNDRWKVAFIVNKMNAQPSLFLHPRKAPTRPVHEAPLIPTTKTTSSTKRPLPTPTTPTAKPLPTIQPYTYDETRTEADRTNDCQHCYYNNLKHKEQLLARIKQYGDIVYGSCFFL